MANPWLVSAREYIFAFSRWGRVIWALILGEIIAYFAAYYNLIGVPSWIFAYLAWITVFVAPLLSIHELRVQRDQCLQELHSREPRLSVAIYDLRFCSRIKPEGAPELLLLFAGITNTGSPSRVENWEIVVRIAGTDPYIATKSYTVTPGTLMTLFEEEWKYEYPASEVLYEKAHEPIATGGAAVGVLSFDVENVPLSSCSAPGTIVRLGVQDVKGNRSYGTYSVPAIKRELRRFPGMAKVMRTRIPKR